MLGKIESVLREPWKANKMSDRIRLGMIFLVGGGWLFNLIAPAFLPGYESNLAANAPLMLLLGSIFASRKKEDGRESGTRG